MGKSKNLECLKHPVRLRERTKFMFSDYYHCLSNILYINLNPAYQRDGEDFSFVVH